MLFPILAILIYTCSGIYVAERVFCAHRTTVRIWLGMVVGLFIWIWLPALLAFVFDFTVTVQWIALGIALALGVYAGYHGNWRIRGISKSQLNWTNVRRWIRPRVAQILLLSGTFLLGAYLLHTHTLRLDDAGVHGGQSTFGDLAMHLGFISSIAEQGTFPPTYNIMAGQPVHYPFLCETPASTLLQLGATLRQATLLSALYAYVLVVVGVYFFFRKWLKGRNPATLATALFFFASGLGFLYFFQFSDTSPSTLQVALGEKSIGTNLKNWLDGMYVTPTNLSALGLRWVNPIADMLIPQRATLFGWAFLFPCLHLLLGWVFERESKNAFPLGILAGGMPLIHTHSFLALGVISAAYLAVDAIDMYRNKDLPRLRGWVVYGGVALILAAPQLLFFTFRQASDSNMVRLHWNWANDIDPYLWFYVKNLGWLAILAIPAFLCLGKRYRKITIGPLALWLLAEVVVFQPNLYDNNKLLFVSYAFLCGLVARFVFYLYRLWKRKTRPLSRAISWASSMLAFGIALFWAAQAIGRFEGDMVLVSYPTIFASLLAVYLLVWLTADTARLLYRRGTAKTGALSIVSTIGALYTGVLLLDTFFEHYEYDNAWMTTPQIWTLIALLGGIGVVHLYLSLFHTKNTKASTERTSVGWMRLTSVIAISFVFLTTFLSGAMTLVREVRSDVLLFSTEEIQAAEFVKENTAPSDLFLTDATYHLNPITSLAGRNIVCGANNYLFYHGIDSTIPREDVKRMLEQPRDFQALFAHYGVDYLYVGEKEPLYYQLDTAFFQENFRSVYKTDRIEIFLVETGN